jgi:hypothetical protein
MKNKLLLLFAVISLGVLPCSFAAFPVRHTPVANSVIATKTGTPVVSVVANESHSWFKTHVTNVFRPVIDQLSPVSRHNGRHGLLALIFGIIGVIPLIGSYFAITAIILGAIGLKHKERLSLAGLILGISGILITVALILIIAWS